MDQVNSALERGHNHAVSNRKSIYYIRYVISSLVCSFFEDGGFGFAVGHTAKKKDCHHTWLATNSVRSEREICNCTTNTYSRSVS